MTTCDCGYEYQEHDCPAICPTCSQKSRHPNNDWKSEVVDEWEKYKWLQVGAVVDYHAIIAGPITKAAMVVREPAQRISGQWVCWLLGKAGYVSCDAVTPVAKPIDWQARAALEGK